MPDFMPPPESEIEWKISEKSVAYPDAIAAMENRVDAIFKGLAPEMVWLLEHPPLYTSGTSAKDRDLKDAKRFPVFKTGRGGQFTYHGPGQRIGYVMLDLKRRNAMDVRAYVQSLERWIIEVLKQVGLKGNVREGRIGVWVETPDGEAKIAALGIRVRKWVTYHGISLNVNPNLEHYQGIVPCGIKEFGVTSLAELGIEIPTGELDALLKSEFEKLFL